MLKSIFRSGLVWDRGTRSQNKPLLWTTYIYIYIYISRRPGIPGWEAGRHAVMQAGGRAGGRVGLASRAGGAGRAARAAMAVRAARQQVSQSARQPGSQAARQLGGWAAGQPGSRAASRPLGQGPAPRHIPEALDVLPVVLHPHVTDVVQGDFACILLFKLEQRTHNGQSA